MPVVLKDGRLQEVDNDKDIDVMFTSADRFTALNANLIPNKENVQSTRIPYGARFAGQSLSLVNREAPLVQNAMNEEEDRSWDDFGGRASGAEWLDDEDDGSEVLDVTADSIRIRRPDGSTRDIGLWNQAPYNRKSYLTQKARVNKGDKLSKGQLLATSNFTDDNGTLALGMNARTAIVADRGYAHLRIMALKCRCRHAVTFLVM